MGIALKVHGIDFSGANLGKVHASGSQFLSGITITGDSEVFKTSRFGITYEPSDTLYEGVVWSIENGGAYASIDMNGELSVESGAWGKAVTIKAVSIYDPSVYNTKEVVVYSLDVKPDAGIIFNQTLETAIVPPALSSAELELRYKVINYCSSAKYGFMMGSRNGNSAGASTDMFCVFMLGTSSEKGNGLFGATQIGNVFPLTQGSVIEFKMNKDGVNVNGINYSYTGNVGSVNPTRAIYIGKVNQPSMNTGVYGGKVMLNQILIRDGDVVVNNLLPYYESETDFGLVDKVTGTKYDIHSYTDAEYVETFIS